MSGRVAGLFALLAVASCTIPRWPVDGTMTSAFGLRWGGLLPEVHRGVDIDVPSGTEVRVMAPVACASQARRVATATLCGWTTEGE